MKTVIKVLLKDKSVAVPEVTKEGDWIDLRAAEDVKLSVPYSKREHKVEGIKIRDVAISSQLINLGIAMKLPAGYEAIVAPRSSTFRNFGVICANSIGVIDNVYHGNNDIWRFNAIAIDSSTIAKGDRICQFRIQLSQKATVWQKIKWLFSSGIKIKEVSDLGDDNRGMNVTGIK